MRTRTYIAADWDHDYDAVKKLYEWNDANNRALNFVDAHQFHQSRDSSDYCSIKKSLKERLDTSKTFVLIVGTHTNSVTKGECRYCRKYSFCNSFESISNKSYIQYECDKAVRDGLKIVVIYNSVYVNKGLCPEIVRNVGIHLPLYVTSYTYNYIAIKRAIMGY